MNLYVYDESHSKHELKNMISNPNLLINSDFRICQRFNNSEITIINGQYCADRWRVYCSDTTAKITFEKVPTGLKVKAINGSTTSTLTVNIYQPYDKNEVYNLIGAKCKVQECINGNTKTYDRTLAIDNGADYVSFVSINGLKIGDVVSWAKLEIGEVATPHVPRTYTEELLDCQRYFVKYENISVILYQSWFNTLRDNMILEVFLPTALRMDNPTLNISNIKVIDAGGAGAVIAMDRLNDSLYKTNQNTLAIKIKMKDNTIFGTSVYNSDIWFTADAEIY